MTKRFMAGGRGRALAYLALAATFTVAACVHTSRRPAEQGLDFPKRCEQAMSLFLNQISLDGGQPRSQNLLNAGIHIARFELLNRARKAVANKNPTCEAHKLQNDLVVEIDAKIEILGNVASSLSEYSEMVERLNGLSILRDPNFARNISCVAHCSQSRQDCDRVCGVERSYFKEMSSADALIALIERCVHIEEGPKDLEIAAFEQIYANHRPRIIEALERGTRESPRLLSAIQNARQKLIEILPHTQLKVLQSAQVECKPKANAFEAKIRAATVFLSQSTKWPDVMAHGTGFHIQSANETRLVTAQHVYNADNKPLELSQRWIEVIGRDQGAQNLRSSSVSFVPEPNMFDRGNDIIQTRVSGEWQTAEVIATGLAPHRQAQYFIAGFPGGIESNFKIYECKFLGYDRAFFANSEQAAYVFSCPAIPGGIQGMSGGPVFDDQARVWGVISAHSELLGRVYAAPLSRNKDGATVLGIQHIFHTDYCFRDNFLGFKKCQMMPGAYSMGP